jgi:hypothetical protein
MMLAFLTLAASAAPAAAADDCKRSRGTDIVICGSRTGQNPYRLPKLPQRYDPKQIRAETSVIPGVQTRAHIDTVVATPDGYPSNRLMVTFSLPF